MGEIQICKSPLEISRDKIKRDYLNPLKSDAMESYMHCEEARYRPDGPFQRDYARVMYSSSFRRLQGKMQLLGIKNDQFFLDCACLFSKRNTDITSNIEKA